MRHFVIRYIDTKVRRNPLSRPSGYYCSLNQVHVLLTVSSPRAVLLYPEAGSCIFLRHSYQPTKRHTVEEQWYGFRVAVISSSNVT
jgi:hypothetical protein